MVHRGLKPRSVSKGVKLAVPNGEFVVLINALGRVETFGTAGRGWAINFGTRSVGRYE